MRGLARACHPAPTVAVTVLAVLLGVVAGAGPARLLLLGTAVLAGQLTIGWSNDLVDAERDRRVGRTDKPLATGELADRTLGLALAVAGTLAVVLSLLLGWAAGLVHLVLLVGSGVAYNVALKRTVWSWLPYAVAFGALPVVAWLSVRPGAALAPVWVMGAGALIGVGAHLVNALPDLADDEATGIRGLPHRIGPRRTSVLAVGVLTAGTAVAVLGPGPPIPVWAWATLGLVVLTAALSLGRGGKDPFRTAILIALVNVLVLLVRS